MFSLYVLRRLQMFFNVVVATETDLGLVKRHRQMKTVCQYAFMIWTLAYAVAINLTEFESAAFYIVDSVNFFIVGGYTLVVSLAAQYVFWTRKLRSRELPFSTKLGLGVLSFVGPFIGVIVALQGILAAFQASDTSSSNEVLMPTPWNAYMHCAFLGVVLSSSYPWGGSIISKFTRLCKRPIDSSKVPAIANDKKWYFLRENRVAFAMLCLPITTGIGLLFSTSLMNVMRRETFDKILEFGPWIWLLLNTSWVLAPANASRNEEIGAMIAQTKVGDQCQTCRTKF